MILLCEGYNDRKCLCETLTLLQEKKERKNMKKKFDIFEGDTSVLCREMFLKTARPAEKPEAGISRVICEIKPPETP